MAIRIRKIDGHTVALCAAKTKKQKGDIYLDDNHHYALATKFAVDHEHSETADPIIKKLMKKEESRVE